MLAANPCPAMAYPGPGRAFALKSPQTRWAPAPIAPRPHRNGHPFRKRFSTPGYWRSWAWPPVAWVYDRALQPAHTPYPAPDRAATRPAPYNPQPTPARYGRIAACVAARPTPPPPAAAE